MPELCRYPRPDRCRSSRRAARAGPLHPPGPERYPSFTQFAPATTIDDEDGPRTSSMTHARIHDDLDRIVTARRRALCTDRSRTINHCATTFQYC